ncbi:LysE/ArgO family amino acid transporter [Microbacterium sp. ASV49]|uniref:LysE/ArgO family amino acid transporter n=1 Tax=Microbacterium candidum TaxID=3041922 RepID=A0ABT7N3R3_9MICO|nr:LysE/ArgO family amino acid transporter [Microbacterium sp. ASV49]MDL9981344.1 LysE/ArgO family amino acid transporter [Microbacterium sp. ASV49]
MLTPVLAGLGLGFSLIVAIGAQNLFVLRQGLRREHVLAVALICALSDVILIALGVSGVGLALQAVPWLVGVVRWVGAAFLLVYAGMAARRAIRPSGQGLIASSDIPASGRPSGSGVATRTRLAPVLLTCLALTWLNPHVYLDTVFLLGSIANSHGDTRWAFAAGAMLASIVWFFALAYGARYLGRWLATPRAWRILDGVIAVVMVAIALNLALGA